jgi:hypothetical protein
MDANIAVLEEPNWRGSRVPHYLGNGKARMSGFKAQLSEREITGSCTFV